jgi:hypothetical protein
MEQKIEWARLIIRAREKILLSAQKNPTPAISPRSDIYTSASSLAADIESSKMRKRSSFTLKQEEVALSSFPMDPESNRPRSRSAGDSSRSRSGSFTNASPTPTVSVPVAPSPSAPSAIAGMSKSKQRSPRDATTSEIIVNGGEPHPIELRKKSKEDVLATEATSNGDVAPSPKMRKKPTLLGLLIGRNDH